MGGSVSQAVNKVQKEVGGELEKVGGGLQTATNQLIADADTITKPFTDPLKKFGGDMANMMGLPGSLDEMMDKGSQMVDKSAAKQMSQRVGLGELGQNMRKQAKQKFGRGQTARTLITGKY